MAAPPGSRLEDPETGYRSDFDLIAILETEKQAADLSLQPQIGRGPERALLSRARAAGATAIPSGLIAVLDSVIAFRRLAHSGPADAALAIGADLAALAYRASGAARWAAAIDARFIVVLDLVRACWRQACPRRADAVHTIGAHLAGAPRVARTA